MDNRMRPIRVGVPSGQLKLLLFEGTDDEELFPIQGKKKPHVIAYGVRYDLTAEEVKFMHELKEVTGCL